MKFASNRKYRSENAVTTAAAPDRGVARPSQEHIFTRMSTQPSSSIATFNASTIARTPGMETGRKAWIATRVSRLRPKVLDIATRHATANVSYFRLPERNCLSRSLRGALNTSSGEPSSSMRPWCRNTTWFDT